MNDVDETLVRDVLHRATDDLTAPAPASPRPLSCVAAASAGVDARSPRSAPSAR